MPRTHVGDQLAISHVIQSVARAYDEKRHEELLPLLFEPAAKQLYYINGDVFDFSLPHGIPAMKKIHDRCFSTVHLVSQPVIDFSAEAARATSAVIASHVQTFADGRRSSWIAYARYADVLVFSGVEWLIRERIARIDHSVGKLEKGAIDHSVK